MSICHLVNEDFPTPPNCYVWLPLINEQKQLFMIILFVKQIDISCGTPHDLSQKIHVPRHTGLEYNRPSVPVVICFIAAIIQTDMRQSSFVSSGFASLVSIYSC